jgi:uncharacterized YkwD family protein
MKSFMKLRMLSLAAAVMLMGTTAGAYAAPTTQNNGSACPTITNCGTLTSKCLTLVDCSSLINSLNTCAKPAGTEDKTNEAGTADNANLVYGLLTKSAQPNNCDTTTTTKAAAKEAAKPAASAPANETAQPENNAPANVQSDKTAGNTTNSCPVGVQNILNNFLNKCGWNLNINTFCPQTPVKETPAQPTTPTQPTKPTTPAQPTTPTKPTQPTTPTPSNQSFEQQVVNLVNEQRAANGLKPLTLNTKLSNVARLKSQDMHDNNYFSHTSPTYGSPFDMMKSFGISYRAAGENIAMGYATPEAVMNGWMNSPGHRANILNPSFTQIGVGYVASGHYWTQEFIG